MNTTVTYLPTALPCAIDAAARARALGAGRVMLTIFSS
jgi:hypothetical protein